MYEPATRHDPFRGLAHSHALRRGMPEALKHGPLGADPFSTALEQATCIQPPHGEETRVRINAMGLAVPPTGRVADVTLHSLVVCLRI